MKISLFAETMGKVQLKNFGNWRVVANASSSRIKVKLYGIILNGCISSQYHLGADDWVNEFYNCVLPAGYGGWNYIVKNASIRVENSLFIGLPVNINTVPVSGAAINCASTTQYMDPYNGTITKSLYNVTLDSNYNITSSGWENLGEGINPDGSVAHIGVYGGQYAWGSKVVELAPDPVETGNAILVITMDNGAIKEYNLTVEELNDFLKWYDSRATVKAYYTFNAKNNVIPFKSIINYIPYDKILYFDVKVYEE